MKSLKTILWGIILVVVGILLGLNSIEIIDFNVFFKGWWTLFIIVPSLIDLFTDKDKTGSIIGIIIGCALLLACRDVIDFDIIWKLAFPTILIIIGLSMVFKDTFNKEITNKINELNKNKDDLVYNATFSGQELIIDDEFKGADMNAVFGGINIDLTSAIINEDVVINCSAIFGGIDIKVPKDVRIKVKSNSLFGGVDNKVNNTTSEKSKTIYINANCIFGGVDIK